MPDLYLPISYDELGRVLYFARCDSALVVRCMSASNQFNSCLCRGESAGGAPDGPRARRSCGQDSEGLPVKHLHPEGCSTHCE